MSRQAEVRATTLEQLFATKEIVVFCGSGGVGKTSAAAAAALGASVRLGGKTLVLTIDPARRLATALGRDRKGKLSIVIYVAAIPAAFLSPWIALALYVTVAVIWLVPDRRIETIAGEKG